MPHFNPFLWLPWQHGESNSSCSSCAVLALLQLPHCRFGLVLAAHPADLQLCLHRYRSSLLKDQWDSINDEKAHASGGQLNSYRMLCARLVQQKAEEDSLQPLRIYEVKDEFATASNTGVPLLLFNSAACSIQSKLDRARLGFSRAIRAKSSAATRVLPQPVGNMTRRSRARHSTNASI